MRLNAVVRYSVPSPESASSPGRCVSIHCCHPRHRACGRSMPRAASRHWTRRSAAAMNTASRRDRCRKPASPSRPCFRTCPVRTRRTRFREEPPHNAFDANCPIQRRFVIGKDTQTSSLKVPSPRNRRAYIAARSVKELSSQLRISNYLRALYCGDEDLRCCDGLSGEESRNVAQVLPRHPWI